MEFDFDGWWSTLTDEQRREVSRLDAGAPMPAWLTEDLVKAGYVVSSEAWWTESETDPTRYPMPDDLHRWVHDVV